MLRCCDLILPEAKVCRCMSILVYLLEYSICLQSAKYLLVFGAWFIVPIYAFSVYIQRFAALL